MSEGEREELKAILTEVFEERVEPKLKAFEAKLSGSLRRRNLALFTAILCLVAAAFSAGYALNSRTQLRNQLETNSAVVCSYARSVALAFREPQVSADGTKETTGHFLERLIAQRQILVAAGHLQCPSIKGFETFPYLRAHALDEIEEILHRLDPDRFHKRKKPEQKVGSTGKGDEVSAEATPAASLPSGTSESVGGGASGPAPSGGHEGSGPRNPGGSEPGHGGSGGSGESESPGGSGGEGGSGGTGGGGGSGGGSDGEEEQATEEGNGHSAPGLVDPKGPIGGVCGTVIGVESTAGVHVCSH